MICSYECGTKLPSPVTLVQLCNSQLGERIASGIDNTIGQLNKRDFGSHRVVLAVTLTILVAGHPESLPVLVVFIALRTELETRR